MLKLTYTEKGFYLELLTDLLEEWLANRVLLCLRAATSIYVEPSTASFLLPANSSCLKELKALQQDNDEILELIDSDPEDICSADRDNLEISLQGTWLTSSEDSEEGIFVCQLTPRAELLLSQLWQAANLEASV
ncbi:hypothetical protein STA3757_48160 [Stanieria sp. NIES-3757]|nr:hypothetical protein STA3757_48160 [Stanieria sp. NIES-3757]